MHSGYCMAVYCVYHWMALFKNLFGQWSRVTSLAKGLLCTPRVIFHKMSSINRLRLPPPSILTIFTLGRARGEGGWGGGSLNFFLAGETSAPDVFRSFSF